MSVQKVALIALSIECIFFGLLLALASVLVCMAWSSGNIIGRNIPQLCLIALMITLSTVHLGASLRLDLETFIEHKIPDGPSIDTRNRANILKYAIVFVQLIVGDCLVVYRCYVLSKHRWVVVVLPTMCALGTFVCAVPALRSMPSNSDALSSGVSHKWAISALALSTSIKIQTFGLIIAYVPLIRQSVSRHVNRHVNLWLGLIIASESAFGTFALLLLLVGLFVRGQTAQYVLWDVLSPVTALAFVITMAAIIFDFTKLNTPKIANAPRQNALNRLSGITLRSPVDSASPITPVSPRGFAIGSESDIIEEHYDDYDRGHAIGGPVHKSSMGTLNSAIVI